MPMLNLDNFMADCVAAVVADSSHVSVLEMVERGLHDPAAMRAAVGEPTRSGIFPLYKSATLTIVNVVWKPGMTVLPHNHDMWAVIGIYGGREDNIFWRRIKDDPEGRIEAAGARALSTGDVTPLGKDIIHSVTNPIAKLTGAIHLYGGPFFDHERSQWDPEHLTEQRYDIAQGVARFED
jgi:predicted metal-dependent enzyme (double-stranded beta helix superfamily)